MGTSEKLDTWSYCTALTATAGWTAHAASGTGVVTAPQG
jgi:hypothetical protein